MGFRKNWNIPEIVNQIHTLARECSSPYNDGFIAFDCKKDLYQLKSIIDDALAEAPKFGETEQKWLTEQEQKRIIKVLQS